MIRFLLLFFIVLFPIIHVQAGVHVWIPDTLACQKMELQLPVYVSSVQASDSIVAYECTIEYDSKYLTFINIQEAGSMIKSWGDPFVNSQEGRCTVAGFTSNINGQQMSDNTQTWLYLHFWIDSDSSCSTEIRLTHFQLYPLIGQSVTDSVTNGRLDIVVNFPPEILPFPGANILEDDSVMIALTDYVHDPNDPWSNLKVDLQTIANIQTDIDSIGLLKIKPESNWSGSALIQVHVADALGEQAMGNIHIEVIPVSDAPAAFSLIAPLNDTTLSANTQLFQFLWQPSENVDPGDQVRYRFMLSGDSLFFSPNAIQIPNLNTTELSLHQTLKAGTYFWTVIAEDQEGLRQQCLYDYKFHVYEISEVQANSVRHFQLHQNFPNPFNLTTTLTFQLDRAGFTILNIVDIKGALVRSLIHQQLKIGEYHVRWDGIDDQGNSMPSGIYWAVLKTSGQIKTIKLCMIK